ncbi:MAG: T9SS type A sorting domain-containing protein [Candidatus Azobacteroides sp.]|nr:T9SS type A sorting domain-containing protein [Candidatus Azobacteroides sp.]
MKKSTLLFHLLLIPFIYIKSQGSNEMWIVQDGNIVVGPTNTSPAGSSSSPTQLDFGLEFTVYLATTETYANETYDTPFLYMQDWQTGTGSVNNGNYQSTPIDYPNTLVFEFDQTATDDNPGYTVYSLTINAFPDPAGDDYPTLMGLSAATWNAIPDAQILRPTFYFGYVPANSNGQGVWDEFIVPAIDIYGYKASSTIVPPVVDHLIDIAVDRYQVITMNLEDSLIVAGYLDPGVDYTWYMDEEYGINPYAYSVNNPNLWLNNVYQPGFKPWINTTHVDELNPETQKYFTFNSAGILCYTLFYYVIESEYVPLVNGYRGGYVDSLTFANNARLVRVQIAPDMTTPDLSNPVIVASEDYGSAAAGTQWRTDPLPANQTNYTFSSGYLPGDGEYSLAQDIVGIIAPPNNSRPMDWFVPPGGAYAPARKYDHTSGDGTGFMYIVNADALGGIFYQNTFDVCPTMNFQSSMWLVNLGDGLRDNNQYFFQYRIKPNINIQVWETDLLDGDATTDYNIPASGTPLLNYYTGEIPMTGIWEQYVTPVFSVPANVDQITIFYLSVNDGGYGNDFMMDDIEIERSNGAFDFSATDIDNCLSASDTYDILAEWDVDAMSRLYGLTGPTTFDYYWTFFDSSVDPSTINASTPGTPVTSGQAIYDPDGVTTENIHLTVPGTDVGTYRLVIVDEGGNPDDQCAIFSTYTFSPAQPPEITVTGATEGDPICPGQTVELSIDISASNIPDVNRLQWWTVAGTDPAKVYIPLIDSSGNQVTGTNVTVSPFSTTRYAVSVAGCNSDLEFEVEVEPAITIALGDQQSTSDLFTYRVCYTTNTVAIPAAYNSGTAPEINYVIYQDSVANGTVLGSGIITQGATNDSLRINISSIKPSLTNFRNGRNTLNMAVTLRDENSDCGNVQYFRIRLIAEDAVWVSSRNTTTPTDNTNWNNDANWYITDEVGNRYGEAGVPMGCTNVLIPADASTYPVLRAAGDYGAGDNLPTDEGFDPQPVCNSITFLYGGEVAQLQHLEYLYAYVEINLGTYSSSENFTNTANLLNTDGGSNYYQFYMSRDRYYSMSAPLKEMYAGDFSFGGKPNAYMKYADPIFIETINPDVFLINKWTNSINSYDVPFNTGFGFAYQVLSGRAGYEAWPYTGNQDNLNAVNGLVRWPYYNNPDYLSVINPRHTYSGSADGSGTSTFSYYELGDPNEDFPETGNADTDQVARTSVSISNAVTGTTPVTVPSGNRFIVEDGSGNYPVTFDVATTDYSPGSEMLLGNPFMSHLDFGELFLGNGGTTGVLGNYFRIWNGASAQYYAVAVDGTGTMIANTNVTAIEDDTQGTDVLISPMQSFFVPLNQSAPVSFDSESMSVIARNKQTVLRNQRADKPETLKIVASNSRYSSAAVIVNYPEKEEPGKGVPKLFSPSGNIPEIYFAQDYNKEIVEINSSCRSIPLGIRTQIMGDNLTLAFHGLQDFSSTISLYDAETNLTYPLSENDPVFTFLNNEGSQQNRFFLLLTPKNGMGLDSWSDGNSIQIYSTGKVVRVNSSLSDPISSVTIYNLQGQLFSSATHLNTDAFVSEEIGEKGIYLIEVKTKYNSVVKKIFIH